MKRFLVILAVLATLTAQAQEGIIGLWLVDNVSVGEMSMTPNAKWVQFNNDESTISGNGWRRHSYGSFMYDDGFLTIYTENGTDDQFGGFDVEIDDDKMTWTREEMGEQVIVSLSRIEELPMAYADELYGLWELKEGNGDFEGYVARGAKFYFGTDRILRIRTEGGMNRGAYRIDAHGRMVEWFPYDESLPRRQFEFTDPANGTLILTSEDGTRLVFERSRQF
ncbi:MAG: hypothetical protein HWD92_05010 [Flavobacteriia bacterium]|nr:hypothetical protein [Flavobacteriia bacterium]